MDDEAQQEPDVDEIEVFAYDCRKDMDDAFTPGRAEWSPNGEWGSTTREIALTHNGSTYRYSIEVRSIVGRPDNERPSRDEYAIYDQVMKKMWGDVSNNDNPEQDALLFVATHQKLQKLEQAYSKVTYYNLR